MRSSRDWIIYVRRVVTLENKNYIDGLNDCAFEFHLMSIVYMENKAMFNFILVLSNLLGYWTQFILIYFFMLKFLWMLRICIICHSLMTIIEEYRCIFSKLNLISLVNLKSLVLSCKIKLIVRLRCWGLIMVMIFVL